IELDGAADPRSSRGHHPDASLGPRGRWAVSPARGRAHPHRGRPSAVRPGPADPDPGRRPASRHHHRVHRRPQHHPGRGDAGMGPRTAASGGGGDRALDCLRGGGDRPREGRARRSGGALAVAGGVRLRAAARARVRERPGGDRAAREADPTRAPLLQRWGGARAAGLRRRGPPGAQSHGEGPPPSARIERAAGALLHRKCRDVSAARASRRVLQPVSPETRESMRLTVESVRRLLPLLVLAGSTPALAQDTGNLDASSAERAFPKKPSYSPYAGRNFPIRPFFGDTHLHTSYSMDAGAFGTRLGPREAYVFARG